MVGGFVEVVVVVVLACLVEPVAGVVVVDLIDTDAVGEVQGLEQAEGEH